MSLVNQLPTITSRSAKRVGRGYGSGKGGHTATRGQKGQKSRRGAKVPLWFEGGQLPLVKRLPMLRGKLRLNKVRPTHEVRLDELNRLEAKKITLDTLKLARLVPERATRAKVVATGKIERPIELVGIKVTAGARKAIETAKGKVLD